MHHNKHVSLFVASAYSSFVLGMIFNWNGLCDVHDWKIVPMF
jgi:hypothetical protein